jgi:YVTN family beta-propeller protein
MNLRISRVLGITAFVVVCLFGGPQCLAQNAYITNATDATVSVINTATNAVIATVPVGIGQPSGVAVTPDGSKVYVATGDIPSSHVSVINTATNAVIGRVGPVPRSGIPMGVAVTPDGKKVYVTNLGDNTVSVISTATNAVIGSPIPVGVAPSGVAVTPDGSKVYVTNIGNLDGTTSTVSVIGTATDTVIAIISVGSVPQGVAVTPDGSKVYVANYNGPASSVSVIDTATNTVVGSPIPVGRNPIAFGLFIQPAMAFAGTPGKANCYGQSVSALARQYHELNNAAAALGFPSVLALQDAIRAFCGR